MKPVYFKFGSNFHASFVWVFSCGRLFYPFHKNACAKKKKKKDEERGSETYRARLVEKNERENSLILMDFKKISLSRIPYTLVWVDNFFMPSKQK